MNTVVTTVAVVLLLSLIVAFIVDGDVRDAVTTVGWAMAVGPILLAWMGVMALLRLLPHRLQPRMIRGRRLSTRALQRVAGQARHDGWMVSSRFASIIVLKQKKADS